MDRALRLVGTTGPHLMPSGGNAIHRQMGRGRGNGRRHRDLSNRTVHCRVYLRSITVRM